MKYLGDINTSAVITFMFRSIDSTGAGATLSGTPVVSVYKDSSNVETTTGVTLTADFDSRTGMNLVSIDTSADGSFYASGSNFHAVITTGTVGGVSVVGTPVAGFSIQNRSALRSTVAGRTLDVSAGGEAGLDWANIGSPTTAQTLSGTSTKALEPTVEGRTLDVSATGGSGVDLSNVESQGSTLNLTATTIKDVTDVSAILTTVASDVVAIDSKIGTPVDTTVSNDIANVQSTVNTIENDVDGVSTQITNLESNMEQRFDDVDGSLQNIEQLIDEIPEAFENAEAVWAQSLDSFNDENTAGEALKQLNRTEVLGSGFIQAVTSQTHFTILDYGNLSQDNDAYNGCVIVIYGQSELRRQKKVAIISDYQGVTAREVFLQEDPGVFTIAPGDYVLIYPDRSLKATTMLNTLDVTNTGAAGVDWGNVENKTTANDLTATNVAAVNGSVGSVTGNLGGSVLGTVSSVTGSVGSVAGNVAGNVSGNVTGSVGSVLAGVNLAAGQISVKKNTALAAFEFLMLDSSNHSSGKTGLTITSTRSVDGGAFVSTTNTATEVGFGIYKIDLSAADLNGNTITLRFVSSGADDTFVSFVTQA